MVAPTKNPHLNVSRCLEGREDEHESKAQQEDVDEFYIHC